MRGKHSVKFIVIDFLNETAFGGIHPHLSKRIRILKWKVKLSKDADSDSSIFGWRKYSLIFGVKLITWMFNLIQFTKNSLFQKILSLIKIKLFQLHVLSMVSIITIRYSLVDYQTIWLTLCTIESIQIMNCKFHPITESMVIDYTDIDSSS